MSDLAWKRLDREIDDLAKADAFGAFELRSYLAARRGRFDEAEQFFLKALSGTDSRLRTVMRFLIVLQAAGLGTKIRDTVVQYRGLIRNDLSAIGTASQMLIQIGSSDLALDLLREAPRLSGSSEGAFDKTVEQLESGPMPNGEEITRAVEFIRNYVRARGSKIEAMQVSSLPFEDGRKVQYYQFRIDEQPEAVADLEWDLFGALGDVNLPSLRAGEVVFALACGE
ncbi:hypothetical protein [Cognatiluteimonas profundi]|uniref:hypothetical protein n=1 Tax=Cognatiluteimonas profundi TaxID=2594501 RepID=UPI00131C13D9|nr:hypothetical protein [Lysobacter profundi]